MKFLYYPGCTLSTTAKRLDRGARLCAAALGIELADVQDWQCCGAVVPMGGENYAQKLAAVRVLAQAAEKDCALVTLCSACFHVMKQVNYQIINDPEMREAIRKYDGDLNYVGGATVLHYTELLRQYIGFDAIKEKVKLPMKGRKIGAYYGCLLLRPVEVMDFDDGENPTIFEEMIRAFGAEAVVYPMRNECCGGYRVLKDKEQGERLTRRVVDSAVSCGAEMLVTACPLCAYQLEELGAEGLEIVYFTELLARVMDVDIDG